MAQALLRVTPPVVPSPAHVSEKRDLWMPLVLALVGLGLLALNLTDSGLTDSGLTDSGSQRSSNGSSHASPQGSLGVGVVAALGGLLAAGICMPLRLKRGQGRMVAFGFGAILCLLSAWPGLTFPTGVVPWWVAGLAFLRPLREATQRTRTLLLGGAVFFVVVALLAWQGIVPSALAWLFLAAAFHLGVHVLASRPVAPQAAPVGPSVAVFGGTFDPFHVGHRALVEAAVRQTDRVLVVVAGAPPHKRQDSTRTAFPHRVAMTRLGVEGLHRVEVLELEGRRPGPSYTVDTLTALARSYPAGTRFRLVVGADAFQEFPTWHDWEGILARAILLVAARPGHELDMPPEFEGRNMPVERLESVEVDVTGARLRALLASDGDVGELLAPAVRTNVRDHHLYQPGGAGSGEVELRERSRP